MCLMCLLQADFQRDLRKSAQIRTDRFEHTIDEYKKSFLVNFFKYKNQPLCEEFKKNINDDKIDFYTNILQIISEIEPKEIESFFNKILSAYLKWINASLSTSYNTLNELLHKYKIFNNTININNIVFFRGRKTQSFLSHWDMFHIPFNKRYLISNERYSLVGQPILYLALSPYTVLNECDSSVNECKISSFYFKDSSFDGKILNFTNYFSRLTKRNDKSSIDNVQSLFSADTLFGNITNDNILSNFYMLIISSCCSFSRRNELKDYSFCEEYVLPQLVAQIVKENGLNGILYSSTKLYDYVNVESSLNLLGDNLALFTNYDSKRFNEPSYVYDRDLYRKFIISNPLSSESLSFNFLDNFNDKITYTLNNFEFLSDSDKDICMYAIKSVLSLEDTSINNERYEDTDIGKLHFLQLHNIIENILNKALHNELINSKREESYDGV